MSDENSIKNNIENNEDKNVELKPNTRFCIISFALILIIVYFLYFIYSKDFKKTNITVFEKYQKPGLYYIGEMTMPRFSHTLVNLNKNEVLIVGGYSKKPDKNYTTEESKESSAEIFDIKRNKFEKIKSIPKYPIHINSVTLDKDNILLTGEKFEVYNKKLKEFNNTSYTNELNKDTKYIGYSCFAAVFKEELLQCNYYSPNNCRIINLKNFKSKLLIKDYKLKSHDKSYLDEAYYIGHEKLNENLILFYQILFYARRNQDMNFSIYDISKNSFILSDRLSDIGKYNNTVFSSPALLGNGKILFWGGIKYDSYAGILADIGNMNYCQPQIYDYVKHKVIKKLNYIYSDVLLPIYTVKLSNGNILIVEKNIIRQIFNSKKMKFEALKQIYKLDVTNFKTINLNEHQILITGGINVNTGEASSSAWIYTY